MATVSEYKCGCIIHEIAGKIRKCGGLTSRSMSGRQVKLSDGGEQRHNKAMEDSATQVWEVANILP